MSVSKIAPMYSLEYMTKEHESKYFDRKSVKIKAVDLARHISGFANADGGTLIIGIDDKTLNIEGINSIGEDRINQFINVPRDCCKPMPLYQEELVPIINSNGEADRLLLLNIAPSVDQVIRTTDDKTYLRIGDKTREMLGDNLRNLEYVKGTRHFEDEINEDAKIEDLDSNLINRYMEHLGGDPVPVEQLLSARGFLKKINGCYKLTNAAVLLLAKNIMQFYPNCRIRFVRYEGTFAQVGTSINIIRDKSFDLPILKIIEEARLFIGSQLREFTALNLSSGKFQIVPEYPEFAWLEGIVNAVAHREYAMSGSYIKVSMYDDRLEIESPGKLPNIVTVENIRETRYSRNPHIFRVLTEFGWVRELNEGVKRIYKDMEILFLDPPEYSEPEQMVKLILKNNIVMRKMRQENRAVAFIGDDQWDRLDSLEREIITFLASRGKATCVELADYTGKTGKTIRIRLNKLMDTDMIHANGKKNDPGRSYELRK